MLSSTDNVQNIMPPITISYIREKWAHQGFQKYFRNTGWMFVAKIVSMAVSFLATIYIARHLGPTNYGQLSYAISFVSLFSFLATLGIDPVLSRDLIKFPLQRNQFLGSAITIKLAAGLTAIFLCVSSAFLFTQKDVSIILIIIISSASLFSSFSIIAYEFQARVESKYPSIVSLILVIIINILKIIIITMNKGVIYLAFVVLLEQILLATFLIYIYQTKIKGSIFDWKFNKAIAQNLIKDSWPMIFSGAFALIYGRIDQVLIKNMLDSQSVGIYDSAVRVAEVWYFIPGIIMTSLFPAIVNAKKTSEKLYDDRLRKLATLLFVLAVGVAIPTMIFAPIIIKIIYGPAFMTGVAVLRIYVWANVGIFLWILANNYLLVENYRKIVFMSSFVSMSSNVILNLLWIPQYGIVGSAYATLISYSLGPVLLLFFRQTRDKIISLFFNRIKSG